MMAEEMKKITKLGRKEGENKRFLLVHNLLEKTSILFFALEITNGTGQQIDARKNQEGRRLGRLDYGDSP